VGPCRPSRAPVLRVLSSPGEQCGARPACAPGRARGAAASCWAPVPPLGAACPPVRGAGGCEPKSAGAKRPCVFPIRRAEPDVSKLHQPWKGLKPENAVCHQEHDPRF
jgi:hypothetical protein